MKLRDALALLEAEHGGLTPKMVVEAARPEDAPLHPFVFDRTIPEAAESWWLQRAQDLIQSVKIRQQKEDGPDLIVRRYVSVNTNGGPIYRDIEKMAQDPIAKEIALRDMRREWLALQSRYKGYQEFWTLIQEAVPETVGAVRQENI
jgi:hypothetical protein